MPEVLYRFVGDPTRTRLTGAPAQDLTEQEYLSLGGGAQQAIRTSALYERNPDHPPVLARVVTGYFAGLDLGTQQDYSALAVLRRVQDESGLPSLEGIHLQRWPLGVSYLDVVADVAAIVEDPRLHLPQVRPCLTIDASGVGLPVLHTFRRANLAAQLRGVVIHGGDAVKQEPPDVYRVPKRDLVFAVTELLQSDRLRFSSQLPEAEALRQELRLFGVKTSDSGHDSFEALPNGGRSRPHDDMVLAVAVAAWQGLLGTRSGGAGARLVEADSGSRSPAGPWTPA